MMIPVCVQISQVCQLCQQSPRLFTSHAAQLHTLLVSLQAKKTHLYGKGNTGMLMTRKMAQNILVRITTNAVWLSSNEIYSIAKMCLL